MRAAAQHPGGAAAEGVGVAAGEVASELGCEAVAGESAAAVADPAGRRFSEPERKHLGVRQTWIGKEPSINGAGARTDRGAGTTDALHQVLAADAGSIGGQAGLAAQPRDQTAGTL